MEVPMRRTDGQVRWMRLHSRPQRMPGGRTIWHGVQIDITEHRQRDQELRSAKAEAERAVLARSKFLAAASHDLRQPVQSLVLLLAAIKPLADTERTAKAVSTMEAALDGLNGLLTSILDISRVDAGVVVPQLHGTDICALLRRLCNEYVPECEKENLRLRSRCHPGLNARTDGALLVDKI